MTLPEHGSGGAPLVVDLYARLSRSPDGNPEKVETQLSDCEQVAAGRGWTIGQRHSDNNRSAWKRDRRRPGWDALLERIKNRDIDGVVFWHSDRLLRQPADLEQLINLADAGGLLLASAYGEHDVSNADHRLALRINAATAVKASDDASRRLRRRFATMRESGVVNGGARAFGFAGNDRVSGEPVAPERVEAERAALRAAAEEVAAGLPVARVVARWNEAGLTTATGRPWTGVAVREVLCRGRNAGLVEHDGVTVGRADGEPILSEELLSAVRAVFAARRRGRVPGERYVGSGLVRCGACGQPLSGRPHNGTYPDGEPRRQYCCQRPNGCGKVAADARRVDAELERFTVERLSDARHASRVAAAHAQAADRLAVIDRELSEARTVHEGLGDRLGRGEIPLAAFDAAMRSLRPRMAALEAERGELTAEAPVGPVDDAQAAATVRAEWADADTPQRRAMLRRALEPATVLYLDPAQRRGAWDPSRVRPADPSRA